ncbi:MAG: 1-acyl-sn-glycerol-3-phosphate acyltransferase [Paludibacteraceae bacterium]|nr:1-acyl-sn-glycerol-3-phosphate acyltransferase [Paludibacteraceae bacterium]
MPKGIEIENLPYKIGSNYMRKLFSSAYYRQEYVDTEKIPQDAAIIFGPNHSNAAIDAISVMMILHGPAVFVARADIFKSKFLAFLLNFCKIMPIMRMRDGYENLSKNKEIMDESVRILNCNVPFCIFSEGTHRTMRNQLPIVKGMFRIALQASESLKGKKDVYILPYGIEYGSYNNYRTSILTQIGEPLNVSAFVREHPEMSDVEHINELRKEFEQRLRKVHLIVPNNGCYDELYECCLIEGEDLAERRHGKKFSLLQRREANQHIANAMEQARLEHEDAQQCLEQVKAFEKARKEQKISARSFNKKNRMLSILTKVLMLIITLPYAIYSTIASSLILIVNGLLVKKMKDIAFHNSARFVIEWLLMPLSAIIIAIIAFCNFAWWIALPLVLLVPPAHAFIHSYAKTARLLRSDIRLYRNKTLLNQLESIRKTIVKYCG